MIFGIDFDNTIVNYDLVFKSILKKEIKLKNKNLNSKKNIKSFLIKNNRLKEWKNIQSKVYSIHIFKAGVNKEILKLMKFLDNKKINFYIVSHKTLYPYVGKKINLHKLSRKWLKDNIFNKKNNFKKKYKIYFEKTKIQKIKRIKILKITHFVDDLDEILNKIPKKINKMKFNNLFKFSEIKKNFFSI
jgi:hypothetical protein